MRLYYVFLIVFLSLVSGCPSASDYVVGDYDVQTRVKTSNCPQDISAYPENIILPTGFVPQQINTASWKLQRIGITGTGTQQVDLSIKASDSSEKVLNMSGTMDDNGFIRIELQLDIVETSYTLYRSILLRGGIEDDHFSGEIRTILSNATDIPTRPPFIPASSPCEVHEEFIGHRRPSGP